MYQNWLFLLIALIAGTLMPTQAAVNNKLSTFVEHPLLAVLISFLIGTMALFAYIVASGIPLSPSMATLKNAPLIVFTGGLLGALYLTCVVFLIPRLGVALSFSVIIAGQMLVTLVIDHFGILGVPVHPLNWQRLIGIVLIITGVILVRRF
jgi:bacterial/archaeal transporter family-2 protein